MIHLGSVGKTSIDVDVSFLILVGLFVLSFYDRQQGIQYALLWIPVLFISIILHELAHAGTTALFGYGASHIVLAGMGGMTISQRRAKPWQEMLIALAGPLSSFVIALLTSEIMWNVPAASRDPMLAAFLPLLRMANIWWGVFNLIPVIPLDGGHVVRSFFRMFLGEGPAFLVSVWIAIIGGAGIAIFSARIGYYFIAILIAWYVFTNWQAWRAFRQRGIPGE